MVSPRLRSALPPSTRKLRLPSSLAKGVPGGAVVPLMATCALAAGIGVGVLWGASQIGETQAQAQAVSAGVIQVRPTPSAAERAAAQPAIAQALAASDEAFQLAPPPPAPALDPLGVALARVEIETPFTLIVAAPLREPAAAPVARASTPAPTTSSAPAPRAAAQEVAGRLAKIAPASDGLPARVRSKPTTSAEIVARIPIGTQLRVLGPADGAKDWLRVTWNGITGYVHSDLIR
jgi:hypothetical protein